MNGVRPESEVAQNMFKDCDVQDERIDRRWSSHRPPAKIFGPIICFCRTYESRMVFTFLKWF